MRFAVAVAPAHLHRDLAQPLVVATDWRSFGAAVLAVLVAALLAGAGTYGQSIRSTVVASAMEIVALAAAALVSAWFVPVLFSSDVYAYGAYGELSRLGIDPYLRTAPIPYDALLNAAAWQWNNAVPVCVYGPAFVALSRSIVATFGALGPRASLDALRAVASLALLACAPLAYAAFDGDERSKRIAAATIVGNPVTIWCAAEGHNDAIALAIVLAGFALVRRKWFTLGAMVTALSGLIKLPGIVSLLGLALIERRTRIASATAVVVVLLLCAPLFFGAGAALAVRGHYFPQASLQGLIAPIAGPAAARTVSLLVCAPLVGRGVARLRHGSREGWPWLGLAGWALVPNPYPWYAIWLVALAAIAPSTRAGRVALLCSFTSLLRYVPDAVGPLNGLPAVALSAAASFPLLASIVPARQRRR